MTCRTLRVDILCGLSSVKRSSRHNQRKNQYKGLQGLLCVPVKKALENTRKLCKASLKEPTIEVTEKVINFQLHKVKRISRAILFKSNNKTSASKKDYISFIQALTDNQ